MRVLSLPSVLAMPIVLALSLVLLLFLPRQAFAEFSIQQLNAITHSPEYLRGEFTQKKYLKDFDVDIVSTGKFDYSQGQYVHWQTVAPIQNLVTMTPSSIVSSQGDVELMSLHADTNPVVTLLSEVFFSVLTAKWQELETYFSLSGEISAGDMSIKEANSEETSSDEISSSDKNQKQWQVSLVPNDAALAQTITHVELKGDEYLRYLKFYEDNGDYTEIQFSQLSQQK
ncbi:outer membrane lipoprotein carrier protein LolA [Alteromonas sp. 1_MG-2023]|uniref:outer membrane lipoprotein carrier protein LolA n=1 Tax=Alteromonas sp. 1_MG-2023 TaxID=3062669 RepID=UPI0026E2B7DD|nr:outer membrane lipoprotein carrier protein LolA [Alteromonas sp. 1_MG-2023]MDO6566967.1 outer membrane lipoprotein carrier protein LolA [Alteromonas sp. 1_MG-2023]